MSILEAFKSSINVSPLNIMKNWYYSVYSLFLYLGTFHLWRLHQENKNIVLIGSISLILFILGFIYSNKKSYFLNKVDKNIHIIVMIDIFFETYLFIIKKFLVGLNIINEDIKLDFHGSIDFYYCAFVMGIVIWLYRFKIIRKRNKV